MEGDDLNVQRDEFELLRVWEQSDRVPNDEEMTAFRRRARLQQAKWRERKGYPIGIYRGHELGSLLEDPENEGRNFLSPHIRQAVEHRLTNKEEHQQLEPNRLRTNMLSSMPLCFNLFGELWDKPDEATKALRTWLPDVEGEVESLRFEWAPGRLDPQYLGNRTAFDAAFLLRRPDGSRGIVGVETKYHEVAKKEETPGPNRLPRYEEVVEMSGAFKPDWRDKVIGTKLQQIWLDHLLVLAMLQHPSGEWTWGRYLLVRPASNSSFRDVAEEYREVLARPETFVELTIEKLLDAHAPPSETEREFRQRYLW